MFGKATLAAANLLYLIGSMWLIIVWKTHVVHGRFFLAGLSILFTIATLLAFAFLVGVVTSSTGVSLMATYAIFFFSAILAAHDKISAAMSKEWAAKLVEGLYWVLMGRGKPEEHGVEVHGDPALAAAFKEWFPGP